MRRPVYVHAASGLGRRELPRPRHRVRAAHVGAGTRRLDEDPDAKPAHVMRLGQQVDIKGIVAGTPDADRAVRYLTKYLTKAVAETYADDDGADRGLRGPHRPAPRRGPVAALLHGVRQLASLRRPAQDAGPGLVPGHCPSKAHDREHLGVGGRRVLVSRGWSGKTLTEHKADRAAVVRASPGGRRDRHAEQPTGWPPRRCTTTANPGSCGRTCPSPSTTTPASSWPPSSKRVAGVRSTTAQRPAGRHAIHLWTTVRQPTHPCRLRPEQRRQP